MPYEEDLGLTILPLEYFRRMMGLDPYHFWQMTFTNHPMEGYSQIYPHERWMYGDQTMPARSAKRGPGRHDIIQAIANAESAIATVSEFDTWPGPLYTENEKVILQAPKQTTMYRTLPFSLLTRWKHIQYVGVQTYTPVLAGAVPVYVVGSDDVTIAVNTTIVADEIAICYPGTQVQIRPITVTKIGNAATITVKRWLMGDPALWIDGATIDATDVVANLLATVDVYRVWIDHSQQILLAWEPDISMCGCLATDSCAICQHATRTACAMNRNYKIGHVSFQASTYDAITDTWTELSTCYPNGRFPDYAYISYQHGFELNGDRYMSRKWSEIVAYLAAANLPDYVYDATSQPDIMYYWREEMATPNEFGGRQLAMADIDNPFGSKRGHIQAWRAVRQAVGD